MSITESELRSAVTWQAFKEAQSLVENGACREIVNASPVWTGEVSSGGAWFKVKVNWKSKLNIDVACRCLAARRGEICAHAVAVILADLRGFLEKPKTEKIEKQSAQTHHSNWGLAAAPRWQEAWRRGIFTCQLFPALDHHLHHGLEEWVKSHHFKNPQILTLKEDELERFLLMLAPYEGKELSLQLGAKINISSISAKDEQVIIQLEEDASITWLKRSVWKQNKDGLEQLAQAWTLESSLGEFMNRCREAFLKRHTALIPLSLLVSCVDELSSYFMMPEGGWFGSLVFHRAQPEVVLELEGDAKGLVLSVHFKYQGSLPRMEGNQVLLKDEEAELAVLSLIQQAKFKETPQKQIFHLSSADEIEAFFMKHFARWQRHGWAMNLSPAVNKLQQQWVRLSPSISIISEGDGTTEFDLQFIAGNGEVYSHHEVRKLLQHQGAGKQKRSFYLDEAAQQWVEPLLVQDEIRISGQHFSANELGRAMLDQVMDGLKAPQSSKNVADLQATSLPATVCATLRPYQLEGFAWMLDRLKRFQGAILADDMGLGKTIQTIVVTEQIISQTADAGISLVVVTTSLLFNWKNEWEQFAPSRRLHLFHGNKRDELRKKMVSGDVVVTTFGSLVRDLAWHLQQEYLITIVDEASLMRNPDTDYAKAITKLNSRYRVALTGTPVENSVRDLWSIFRFVQPHWLGSRQHFKETYEQAVQDPARAHSALAQLRIKASPFLLRRNKQDVAKDLPSKIIMDEYCVLSNDQRAAYQIIQKEGHKLVDEKLTANKKGAARMQMLTTLLRLRQASCDLGLLKQDQLTALPITKRSSKLDRLLELVTEAIAGGHRILVFSQFQQQLMLISDALKLHQISHLRLDGATRDRQKLVQEFQQPEGPSVFLISLKAGGYGLNLTAADTVIHFDPWWNPAAEAQASDRAHRIGQTRPVTIYRLIAKDTVEENVIRMQEKKRSVSSAIEDDGTSDPTTLSEKDLSDLISSSYL